ncbi:GTPase-activating of the rho rac family (LRG1) [Fusarium albosuccineum]|uniref:GTPase-activating of the rho rac family (LRG1) n=1 Tax=Fusarium albosuccineum TaxID=1237068 RepID=A0A8H4LID7_9HYPO|nr:GTPase-activating of the rho rac family (LRG1) [Fusarium albosuccineum]
MEPLSIATAVVGLTATCLTTCKKLSDLAGSYGDVPVMIAMICSESTVISIALSELQMKILRREDLSQAWASKNEILVVFETVLTGCMTVFSCLEAETRRLHLQNPGVWAKLKFMWSQDRLNDLLNALRGQQTAIVFLLKVLEIDTLSDIQREIRVNKTKIQASVTEAQSLRSRSPSIKIQSQSIFDNDIAKLSLFEVEASSAIAPSELDFEFDDLVLNSQAYRRAFARAQEESQQPERHIVEGDLIDLSENTIDISDVATIREINQDLKDLTLVSTSNTPQPTTGSKLPHTCIVGRIGIDESLQLYRRNSWDEPDTNFCTREIGSQSNESTNWGSSTQLSVNKIAGSFRECTKCDECDTVFGAQDSYYCQNHAERCHFCKFPILAQYLTHRQGKIRKYSHPTCSLMSREWDITLPLTLQPREDATTFIYDILGIREEHESCIERVYQVTSKFLDAYREELAKTSDAYAGERQAEAFEHYKPLIALTSVVLKAASEVKEGAIGASGMSFLSQALHHYLKASFIVSSVPQPIIRHIEAVVTSLKPIIKLVLEASYSKSGAGGRTLDKFLVNLSATKSRWLHLPYDSEPSSKNDSGMKCERCHLYVRSTAYSAISTPDLRWHPDCWKCEKCEQPVHIVSSKSQNKIEHSEYKCRCCGYEGSFWHIPDYSQFVYIMWRAWGHVAALDWSQP